MNTTEKTITAYELGEDGEDFIVAWAVAPSQATAAVRQYCVDTWGETLEHNAGEDHVELEAGPYREDWAWKPVHEDYPMDEALLVHGDEAAGLDQFEGWRVSVA